MNNKKDLKSLLNKINPQKIDTSTTKKLSLCMIVKNEEKNIARCLNSVKGIVDEIVIVDTGSTDRTVEIAKGYGAEIFYYEWNNDFSAARNYSIDKSTGDWILVLDADEELDNKSIYFLNNLKTSYIQEDVFSVTIKNLSNQELVSFENKMERLFKKSPQIKFQGKIHEFITSKSSTLSKDKLCILHYGYSDSENTLKKEKNRNIPLLIKEQKDSNNNDSTIKQKLGSILYLGQSYLSLGEYQLAEFYFRDYIQKCSTSEYSNEVPYIAYFSLMSIKSETHEFNEIEKLLNKSYNTYGVNISSYGDYWFFKALVERNRSMDKLAIEYFNETIKAFNKNFQQNNSYLIDKTRYNLALYYLCELYSQIQDFRNLFIYSSKVLENVVNPNIRKLLFNLLNNLTLKNTNNSIYKKIENLKKKLQKEFPNENIKNISTTKKLSLCMIVKNEEKNIARCLNSVKGIVDEIVIVDTGSTDRTVEIAKGYGAEIFYYEWNNDFSAARNYSIDKSTGDWILVLDADEELSNITKDKFKSFFIDTDLDICFNILIKNVSKFSDSSYESENYMSRLFNNTKNNKYVGRVHERLKTPSIFLDSNNLHIIHYGYKDRDFTLKKQKDRNLPLLEKIIEEESDNINEKLTAMFYLGLMKLDTQEYDLLKKYFIEILEHSSSFKFSNAFLATVYSILIFVEYIQKNDLEMKKLIEECESTNPIISDVGSFWFYKGALEQEKSNIELAVEYYLKSIDLYKNPKVIMSLNAVALPVYFMSLLKICEIYILNYNEELLNKYINIYLEDSKEQPNHRINLSIIYFDLKRYNEVLELNYSILDSLKNKTQDTSIDSLSEKALNNISKVYMIQQKYSEAFEIQFKLHQYDKIKNEWFKLAKLLENQGNLNTAKSIYSTIILNVNNDFYPFFYRASISFIQNDIDSCLEDLTKAFDLAPELDNKIEIIKLCMTMNKLEIAEKYISSIFSENDYKANILKAEIYKKRKEYIDAEKILNHVLINYPNNIEVYIELGNLYLNSNNLDESIKILEKALTVESNNIEVIYLLASILLIKQDYENSKKIIDLGIQISNHSERFIMLKNELEFYMETYIGS